MLSLNRFLAALLFALSAGPSLALEVKSGAITNQTIFGIEFPKETRSYYSHAGRIQSISLQDYLTASFRVTELNIVSQGSALLRIYHSRPLRAGELQQALADGAAAAGVPGSAAIMRSPITPQAQALADRAQRVGDAVTSTEVVKEYPSATHAHTIEYRIATLGELLALHQALTSHWLGEAKDEEGQSLGLGGTLFVVETP